MKPACRRRGGEQGIALIVVMLVIIVLAGLVAGFAGSMRVEMRLARFSNSSAEMEWIGRSGLELARYTLAMQARVPGENNHESLNQKWAGGTGVTNELLADIKLDNVPLGGGLFTVTMKDAERKFNINAADEQLLQQALTVVGVDASEFSTIVDCILDWRDPDNNPRLNGAENDYYLSLIPPYYCKNGYIDDLTELLLVKGINSDIYWGPASTNHFISTYQKKGSRKHNERQGAGYAVGLADLFNTLSSGRLNLNTASATALLLIPGMDQNVAQEIIQRRAGLDGVDGTEDDTPFLNPGDLAGVPGITPVVMQLAGRYCDVRSQTFEVRVDVALDGLKRTFFGTLRRNPLRPNDFVVVQFYWN
jgi:general secretion pathway protein K